MRIALIVVCFLCGIFPADAQSRRCTDAPQDCTTPKYTTDAYRQPKTDQPIAREDASQDRFVFRHFPYFSIREVRPAYLELKPPRFSLAFTDTIGDKPTYGVATVSLPHGRAPGENNYGWDTPFKNPLSHFYMFSNRPIDNEHRLVEEIRSRVVPDKVPPRVLIYVHGARNNFEDAAEGITQLSEDIKFSGIPIFLSWPAPKPLMPTQVSYIEARRLSERSEAFLVFVLQELLSALDLEVTLIAHSLGGRIAGRALTGSDLAPTLKKKVKYVIYAASDATVEEIHTAMTKDNAVTEGQIIINYCSESDAVLRESRVATDGPRLGDCSNGVRDIPGVETIVVRGALGERDALQHSWLFFEPNILRDIQDVTRGVPKGARTMVSRGVGAPVLHVQPRR